MKIAQTYSHLNGEEYLIVHHNTLYNEIKSVVGGINATTHLTKVSKEARKMGTNLYSPASLNIAFDTAFTKLGWASSTYNYYITLNRDLMEQSIPMDAASQRKFLISKGEKPIRSYNQTDFVKNQVAEEVQFGKYSFVAYDLFVKHMMFYSAGKINVGIEILPTKKMQDKMSSGPAYFEGEVYNVMRQGRNSPPVPLIILGIEA